MWISTEQTYQLMSCLEELHTAQTTANKTTWLPPEKEKLIRIALAENLARAFLHESNDPKM